MFFLMMMMQKNCSFVIAHQDELEKIFEEERGNIKNYSANAFTGNNVKPGQTLVKFGWIRGVFVRAYFNYLV